MRRLFSCLLLLLSWSGLFLLTGTARAEEPAVAWRVCVGDLAIMPYLSGDASNSGMTEKLLLAAGKPAGLAVELLHIPYRRCRLMFEAGEVDVLTVGATPTNLQQLQFPLNKDGALDTNRRLARINLVLVRRVDTVVDWDGKQLIGADPKTFMAGARNTLRLGIDAMQSMGYKVDDGSISTAQTLSKLAAHRIDMAIGLEDEVAQALLHDPVLRKELVVLPRPFSLGEYYVVTHKELPPDLQRRVELWWTTLAKLRDTAAFRPH